MVGKNGIEFKYKELNSKRIVRIYRDSCPLCGKIRWMVISKLGRKCKSCHVREENKIARLNWKKCDVKNCCKKCDSKEKFCHKHRRMFNPIERKKNIARNSVKTALKNGSLIKLKCRKCGDIKSQAHHEDYKKPLDVIWLCRKCHQELHNLKKESNKKSV